MTDKKLPIGLRARKALAEWLLGPFTPATASDFIKYWNVSSSSAGQTVSETTALKLSAAWACARLISESVATMPIAVYERTPTGRRRAEDHQLWNILHNSPNADQTPTMFWQGMVASMLFRGNSFAEIRRIGNRIVALNFLAPSRLSLPTYNGKVRYMYTESTGVQREIPPQNIFHVPAFSLDGKWGLSAIQYGSAVFGSALAAQNAANGTFENGLMPTVAFTVQDVLTPEQRTDFRTYAATISGALNAGTPAVLEGGMTANQIGISPKDAQLLESRLFNVEEVCRWFRVDPSMVGHGGKDSNFGTGLEAKMRGFIDHTLRHWLVRIQQQINLKLMPPGDRSRFYAEYVVDALMWTDSKTRAEFYQIMVDHGLLTRDEVRTKENMEPFGGNASRLTVNGAMVDIDAMATPGVATGSRGAGND